MKPIKKNSLNPTVIDVIHAWIPSAIHGRWTSRLRLQKAIRGLCLQGVATRPFLLSHRTWENWRHQKNGDMFEAEREINDHLLQVSDLFGELLYLTLLIYI